MKNEKIPHYQNNSKNQITNCRNGGKIDTPLTHIYKTDHSTGLVQALQ